MRLAFIILFINFSIYFHGQSICDSYVSRGGKYTETENAQIVPYKDYSNLWGLKNKKKDSIIIPAQYKGIYENLNDT